MYSYGDLLREEGIQEGIERGIQQGIEIELKQARAEHELEVIELKQQIKQLSEHMKTLLEKLGSKTNVEVKERVD